MALYSVVVPVYNSAQTLEPLAERLGQTFADLQQDYELIFVEDCGPDNSWEVLQKVQARFPQQVTIVRLSRNAGQHNATMCGFHQAKGDFVITIDDDLQCPPEEIKKLVAYMQGQHYDMVYGVYAEKKHHAVRNLGSRWIKSIYKIAFNAKPDGSSFRLIRRSLIQKLTQHSQPFVFIDGLIHWHTTYLGYCEVEHKERAVGRSNYTVKKLVSLTMNLIFNFTVLPLRFVTYLGIFTAIISFCFGFYFIFNKLMHDVPIGYTSVIVSLFFSTGLILISLGIIGEYLSRIFVLQNHKPQYSVAEIRKGE